MIKTIKNIFHKKVTKISKGDVCYVELIKSDNEVIFLGEFIENNEVVACCSSPNVNELLFVPRNLLIKKSKQPTSKELLITMQIDTITTLKEINSKLKSLMHAPHEEDFLPKLEVQDTTKYH